MSAGARPGPCFDLVIFDMDGVLVDTTPCHAKAYAELWRRLGAVGPPYSAIAGRTTRESIAEWVAADGADPAEVAEWVAFKQERARAYLATEPILFPDTRQALEAVSQRVERVALGTSASRRATDIVLSRFDLGGFFSTVVTGDAVARGKPAPDIYLQVMREVGVGPDHTLVIEDSAAGLESARASGAFVAGVRGAGGVTHPRFLGWFSDLADLAAADGLWKP